MLSTWKDNDYNSDCCIWQGIQCNNETGHVHMLQLPGQYPQHLKGEISITSLLELQNMECLDLRKLTRLRYLDLSYNFDIYGEIPYQLGNISRLSIYLDQNLLEGPIPDRFGKAMNSLEVLRLGTNKLKGTIPASLGNLCTLQELHLYNNNLSGGISSFIHNISWCNRHKFQSLNLSHDLAIGMLPNHSILSSLRALDLSRNQLTGEIPKSIGLLHDLDYLYLNGNNLEGDITETHFTNLSKLRVLDLSDNSFSLKVGTTWVPPFQLFRLGLASCKLGPTFPRWLQTQSQIEFLDISDAGIDDFVPEWFWNNLRSLCQMNMSCNNLKGTIPDLPIMFAGGNRNMLIRSSNKLEGGIPTFLKQADSLDLSKDKITDLKTFLCGKNITTEMRTLDLSKNQIMGQLPDCWEHLTSLRYLDLSNNKLSGSLGTLVYLEDLVLRNNKLSGELPLTLKNCTNLVKLDASENFLSGPIPPWIGESLKQLRVLSLRVNHFFGSVPVHICYLRQNHLLILSRNHLSGGIPTCLTVCLDRVIF
uniref:Receptor-like protein kinase 2 n=1 Tax=Cajanus cajan TaxID=3821 RepID=A0A151R0E7_CAJCA|nr:Receptor-like protein kinase 2 [Cajanus cajan]